MHPGTVHRAPGPFRRALLGSTASDTPDADKLATHAEHVRGWPVIVAAAAAQQAGLDWRPAALAARQHITDELNRQRARLDPPRVPSVRVASIAADAIRCDGRPSDQ